MSGPTRTALASRLPRSDDDRGSLAMAMMAILVGATLGALIIPIVISQTRSTRFDITRVHSLHAAQTGVDVMMGRIRASTRLEEGNPTGNPGTLPCETVTGTTNEGTGRGTFSVSVTYWTTVPPTQKSAQAASVDTARPMICSTGYGTFDPVTQSATPRYAVIVSTGTDGTVDGGSRGRRLESTYVFQTDDTNISGGQFRLFPDGSAEKWCMQADDTTPVVGTRIVLRACSGSNPPLDSQVFSYRTDLSIQLVSSAKPATPAGLCIDTEPTAHDPGTGIVLKTCGVADPAKCADITRCSPWNQQWSVNDYGHLEGARVDQSDVDDHCIQVPAQADGTPLRLQTPCTSNTDDPLGTWVPSPNAGAGMAGADNNQLVNYRQFATCLDVTGTNVNADFLILYTCKQNPNPGQVTWNQKFAPSSPLGAAPKDVLLKTTKGGVDYCLTSPLSDGGYPTVKTPCPPDAAAGGSARWTMYQTEDASGSDLPYAQKYTIVDANGLCLGPNSQLVRTEQYLRATVSTCDGSTGQKWNASASLDRSRVIATHEIQAP